ncbi:MAG: hypothetical protein US96_C0005G0008 [Candidatus Woesebacteria bacterium GW2011_GWB1_38_5b]|uniref:Sugar O-methyltransferase n=1 Tax=Candidatus Woesebacteria bacterium GW2011_GWB1_38_5b TaxID=1618569 RepID=A0A0G0KJS5_9BACT|nr:MAG: hypothetical protein US96_C0005G0008 [Candidatus Woesebacteria bacterium GW2011_GWB1_38_5b]
MKIQSLHKKIYNLFSNFLVTINQAFVPDFDNNLLVSELRHNIKTGSVKNTRKRSKNTWEDNVTQLEKFISSHNPTDFLQSDVVRNTMFVGNTPFTFKEFGYLKSKNWNRWKKAVVETNVIPREPFILYPKTSGNSVHHAYHLAKFENSTKHNIENSDLILEFGGGYGNMCRIIHNLNFNGKYIIFDLPPFSALQTFYLKTNNITAVFNDPKADSQVYCLSSIPKLRSVLKRFRGYKNKTFIATWSLSESPISFRNKIITLLENFDFHLIAYQSSFSNIDNIEYFKTYQKKIRNHRWFQNEIKSIPNNFYLFGKPSK